MAKIGVGVPTYNRSSYLRETLQCLRDQISADFCVVVMDNASTDDTGAVFDEIVGDDHRFTYARQPHHCPVLENFDASLKALSTEYFLWRADDDLSAPNYLSELAAGLDANPEADLAISPFRKRKGNTERAFELPRMVEGTSIDRAIFLLRNSRPTWVYGMWRRDALLSNMERMQGRYNYIWASDHAQMLPSVLAGRVTARYDTWFLQRIIGQASYHLAPSDQLNARHQYEEFAQSIIRELDIPVDKRSQLIAALNFHLDDRVGPLWRLRRRLVKQRLKQAFGFG